MNIAIIGYGTMGNLAFEQAKKRGHTICAVIDPFSSGATAKGISKESMGNAEVAIEFSAPSVAVENARKVAATGCNHIMATTGWYEHMDEMKAIIRKSGTGFLWASNFSIGVNMFFRIVSSAAKIADKVDSYDVFSYELHHNRKQDSPSGTARSIAQILIANISRKKTIVEDKLNRKIAPDELHVASIRGGDIPGTHVVAFDSTADSIELKHTARNRNGFALGSVLAAEWAKGKTGFFTIDQMMDEVLGRE